MPAATVEDFGYPADLKELPLRRRGPWPLDGKGRGGPRLGGRVAPDNLRAVLEGTDPKSGEKLVRWRRRPGYDLTLSAPKSVSLLWGLGDRPTAAAVAAAHDAAVDVALEYLEDAACVVRRGEAAASAFRAPVW